MPGACKVTSTAAMTQFGAPSKDSSKRRASNTGRKPQAGAWHGRPRCFKRCSSPALSPPPNSRATPCPLSRAGNNLGSQMTGGTAKGRAARGSSGGGRRPPAPPAAPPQPAPSTLHRLAARVQHDDDLPPAQAAKLPPRHMRSAVGELLGGPRAPPPVDEEPSWDPLPPQRLPAVSPQARAPWGQQEEEELQRERRHAAPYAAEAPPPSDYSRRNMARLGGDGVAGIFGAPSTGQSVRIKWLLHCLDCLPRGQRCHGQPFLMTIPLPTHLPQARARPTRTASRASWRRSVTCGRG